MTRKSYMASRIGPALLVTVPENMFLLSSIPLCSALGLIIKYLVWQSMWLYWTVSRMLHPCSQSLALWRRESAASHPSWLSTATTPSVNVNSVPGCVVGACPLQVDRRLAREERFLSGHHGLDGPHAYLSQLQPQHYGQQLQIVELFHISSGCIPSAGRPLAPQRRGSASRG